MSLQQELIELLKSGGSESEIVLANILESNRQMSLSFDLDLDDTIYIKMFDLQLNPGSDTFS